MYGIDVLIADDDVAMVQCIGEALDLEGLSWRHTPNGQACLEALTQHRYSTLLLDLSQPIERGYEVLTWLHDHPLHPSLTVVIFSAVARDGRQRLRGVHRVVRKPCELPVLLQAIKEALPAPRSRQAR